MQLFPFPPAEEPLQGTEGADWQHFMAFRNRQPYQSYLLRLWRDTNDGQPIWRASLESAQTGEKHHFASHVDLLMFLAQRIAEANLRYEMEVAEWYFENW